MNRTILSAAAVLVSASGALADITFPPISGVSVGPGMGATSFSNPNAPTISNDDVPGLEQIYGVQIQKRFDATATIDSPLLLNVNAVQAGAGVTGVEYTLFELVTNNTGQTWTGFEMELGEGLLAGFGPYLNANINVTFDVPNQNPAPICSAFPIVSIHNANRLVFSGGSLAPGGVMSIRFQMDNNTPVDLNADGNLDGADIYGITLREIPLVPAPGCLGLAALVGLSALRRRR